MKLIRVSRNASEARYKNKVLMWASLTWWVYHCGFCSESLNRENNLVHHKSSNYFNLPIFYIKHNFKVIAQHFLSMFTWLQKHIKQMSIFFLILFNFRLIQ